MIAFLFFILVVVIPGILGLAYFTRKAIREEAARSNGLKDMARELDLEFNQEDPYDILRNYRHLNILRSGDVAEEYARGARNRKKSSVIENVYSGNYRGRDILLFDFRFRDQNRILRYNWCMIVKLPGEVPESILRPHGSVLDLVGVVNSLQVVKLDEDEFSRRYALKAEDEKQTYAYFSPRMREKILGLDESQLLEMEKDGMIRWFEGRADPVLARKRLDVMIDIVELIPAYLLSSKASLEDEENQEIGTEEQKDVKL